MPTENKKEAVKKIQEWMSKCTVAISTDFTNLPVSEMTELRESLRKIGINYKVIKNTLGLLAAEESGMLGFKEIISGPTGIAYGFDEPTDLAKVIFKKAKNKGSVIQIKGGVIDGKVFNYQELEKLSELPSRDQLIVTLLMRLQSPIYGLVNTLDSPVSSLARVIQARINQEENK